MLIIAVPSNTQLISYWFGIEILLSDEAFFLGIASR